MNAAKQLHDFMLDENMTQAAVARAVGLSPATINQYLQGKYRGDATAVETAVDQYIKRTQEKKVAARQINAGFVETHTARRILEFIRLAHIDCEIQVLYGEAGLGKTMALKHYAANHSDVLLLEADPCYTARVVLEELCLKLGVPTQGNMHELTRGIVGKLRDSGRLIIIDEAELLPHRALEILRRIHDKTGVGLVLAGMPRLIINLKGQRGEFKQLFSRVAYAHNLGNTLPSEDIVAIAAAQIPDQADELAEVLYTESRGNGRRLSKLLKRAVRICSINGSTPSSAIIKQVAGMLIN